MTTTDPLALLREYDAWREERAELSAQESSGNFPSSDAWHGSDDDGCALAARLADALREATAPQAKAAADAEWYAQAAENERASLARFADALTDLAPEVFRDSPGADLHMQVTLPNGDIVSLYHADTEEPTVKAPTRGDAVLTDEAGEPLIIVNGLDFTDVDAVVAKVRQLARDSAGR